MIVRIGNDFVFLWSIERNGQPENLNECLEIKLFLKAFGMKKEIDFEIVNNNIIRIEVTPEMTTVIGIYSLVLKYILVDESLSDNDRKCAVDTKAFTIVADTAMADDISEIAVTSDLLIGLKGDKGDKGDSAYQVWLEEGNTGTEEDYFAYLRQPAVDAGASISELEGAIQVSEGLRVEAESERVQDESLRTTAESSRELAESLRVDAELLRQTNTQIAITNAENATENANTSAQNANDARLAIQDDLALKANHGYEINPKTLKQVDDRLEELSNNWIKEW